MVAHGGSPSRRTTEESHGPMKTTHQHRCHVAHAVNARAIGAGSTITTYPWLDTTDMAFATKRQRLKDHPG